MSSDLLTAVCRQGWKFNPDEEGCTEDTAAGGITFIRELYEREGSAEKSVRLFVAVMLHVMRQTITGR